jgi:hypothetical protein
MDMYQTDRLSELFMLIYEVSVHLFRNLILLLEIFGAYGENLYSLFWVLISILWKRWLH